MSLLPPSLRPGEPVQIPGAPRSYSVEVPDGWAWIEDGRLWKMEKDPSEEPLYSGEGLCLAPSLEEVRKKTDATLLRGDISEKDLLSWAEGVTSLQPRSICVFPSFLPTIRDLPVRKAAVVSFPHGADTTKSKIHQIEDALEAGADEIDLVAPLRYIQASDWKNFRREIQEIGKCEAQIKLILETSLWSTEQISRAAQEAVQTGTSVLKTSTGTQGGASSKAVALMLEAGATGIKASGGVRSRLDAGKMIRAGATMFGSSNLEEWV